MYAEIQFSLIPAANISIDGIHCQGFLHKAAPVRKRYACLPGSVFIKYSRCNGISRHGTSFFSSI
jgi:hypothetical protein